MLKKYCPFSYNVVQKTDENYNYDENNNLSNNTRLFTETVGFIECKQSECSCWSKIFRRCIRKGGC